jgi:hypothetical protein
MEPETSPGAVVALSFTIFLYLGVGLSSLYFLVLLRRLLPAKMLLTETAFYSMLSISCVLRAIQFITANFSTVQVFLLHQVHP